MVVFRQEMGLIHFSVNKFIDRRGYFSETYSATKLLDIGIETNFVQDNVSVSKIENTIRGLHYQAPPRAQAK